MTPAAPPAPRSRSPTCRGVPPCPRPNPLQGSCRRVLPSGPRDTTERGRSPPRNSAALRGGERLYVTVTAVIVVAPFLALGLAGWLLWGSLIHPADILLALVLYTVTGLGDGGPSPFERSRELGGGRLPSRAHTRRIPCRPSRTHRAGSGRIDELPGRRHRLGRHPPPPPRLHRPARRPALPVPLWHAPARPVARAAARARRLAVPQRPDARCPAPSPRLRSSRGTPIAPDLLADHDIRAVSRALPPLCVLTLALPFAAGGPSAVRGGAP